MLGFLTIVAIAKAAKLDEEPLDIVVVDALGKGEQENTVWTLWPATVGNFPDTI